MSVVPASGLISGLSKEKADLLKLLIEEESRSSGKIQRRQHSGTQSALLPTSWAQQRLWFLDQFEGANAAYCIPLFMRLRGRLDEGALRRALDSIVERHEVLRTVFVKGEDRPFQQVLPGGSFSLSWVDLSSCAASGRESRLRSQEEEESSGEFDLATGPLIRGRLVRLAGDDHALLISMHHIVFDGWSLGVFLKELGELYAAYREGRGSQLAPLAIQYADYAQWQRNWLEGEVLRKQLAYWQEQLEGAPPYLDLPTDRPRPSYQSYRGGSIEFTLDEGLTQAAKGFAAENNLTLYMVLYAAFGMVLSRLSGQEEVVLGTPIANRQKPELEAMIGFFANTLALRIAVNPQLTIREFMQRIREVTLEAFAHQDAPFEQVVERIQPARSLNRNPIFQVMFVMQNAPKRQLQFPQVSVEVKDGQNESSMFDLLLLLEAGAERVSGVLNYSADVFDRETVARWVEQFKLAVGAIVRQPDARLRDVSIL